MTATSKPHLILAEYLPTTRANMIREVLRGDRQRIELAPADPNDLPKLLRSVTAMGSKLAAVNHEIDGFPPAAWIDHKAGCVVYGWRDVDDVAAPSVRKSDAFHTLSWLERINVRIVSNFSMGGESGAAALQQWFDSEADRLWMQQKGKFPARAYRVTDDALGRPGIYRVERLRDQPLPELRARGIPPEQQQALCDTYAAVAAEVDAEAAQLQAELDAL